MRIAAKLAEPAQAGKIGAEKGQEAASGAAIAAHGRGTPSESKSLNVGFKDFFETGSGLAHRMGEDSKRSGFRWPGRIRPRHPWERVGHRAWWCGSENVP